MKKSIITLFLLSFSIFAFSQVMYGPKIGGVFSSWKISERDQGTVINSPDGMKSGLLLGFYVKKQFASQFFVQAQLDYRTFVGGLVTSSSVSGEVGGASIYVPVTFGSSISYNFQWYLGGAIGGTLDEDDGFEQFNSSGSSGGEAPIFLLFGISSQFDKFNIDAGYYMGMTAVRFSDNENWKQNQVVVTLGLNLNSD